MRSALQRSLRGFFAANRNAHNVRQLHSTSQASSGCPPSANSTSSAELPCEELRIPMPWGYVAAKWWGRQDVRPVLAVHGWLDNAGTFDRLAPLLPRHIGYLCVDLPGHGRSSHFDTGMNYSSLDFLHTFELVRVHYGWPTLSLLAHSMGAMLSYLYAAVLPERTDLLIGIDMLRPLHRRHELIFKDVRAQLEGLLEHDQRISSRSVPPCYTQPELIERMVKGTRQSVTADVACHLLRRSVAPAPDDPTRFYFSRDSRMKLLNYMQTYHELSLEMARRIRAPHLFIKATQAKLFEPEAMHNEALDVLRASNPLFRMVLADGTHHIQLTNPAAISDDIGRFLREYRPEAEQTKSDA